MRGLKSTNLLKSVIVSFLLLFLGFLVAFGEEKPHPAFKNTEKASPVRKIKLLKGKIVEIPSISESVGKGEVIFEKGKTLNTLTIKINGIAEITNQRISRCSMERIQIAPNLKVPLKLFTDSPFQQPEGIPYVIKSQKFENFVEELTISSDDKEFIISGSKGAVLQKIGKGFLLLEGEAWLQNIMVAETKSDAIFHKEQGAKKFVIKNENFQLSSYAKDTLSRLDPLWAIKPCYHTIELIASEEVEEPKVKMEITADGHLKMTMNLKPKDIDIIAPSKGTDVREADRIIWCKGATHIWKGIFFYGGYIFESSLDNPLEFKVTEEGYIYVKGKGTVTTPSGEVVRLPLAKSERLPTISNTVIRLTKASDRGSGGRKFHMEVLKGDVKEKWGAVFREGSSLSIDEDEILYEEGMTIIVGKGGIELRGKFYPEGTKLKVGEKGELIKIKRNGSKQKK